MGGGASKRRKEDALTLLMKDEAVSKRWVEEKTFEAENSLIYAASPLFNELRKVLGEPLGQKYLGEFAKLENSQENFFAWIDMEEFKSIPTPDYRLCQARNIFKKYIKEGGVMQLGMMTQDRIKHYEELIFPVPSPSGSAGLAPGPAPAAGGAAPNGPPRTSSVVSGSKKPDLKQDLFIGLQHTIFREMVENTYKRFKDSPLHAEYQARRSKSYNAVDINDFDYLSFLGQGAFGVVAHVRKKSTGQEYAMKVMSKARMVHQCGGSTSSFQKRKERICIERDTYVNAGMFPFIVSMHYAFLTPLDCVIVMEFARGGTLHSLMQSYPHKQMPEAHAKFIFCELMLALQHMHISNYLHRDLKPINVLITADGHIALADMGLVARIDESRKALHNMRSEAVLEIAPAEEEEDTDKEQEPGLAAQIAREEKAIKADAQMDLHEEEQQQGQGHKGHDAVAAPRSHAPPLSQKHGKFEGRRYSRVGTMGYKAPELLKARRPKKNREEASEGYGESVDWWSMGVMLFEMYTGKNPFQPGPASVVAAHDVEELERNTLMSIEVPSERLPADISPAGKEFLDGLLQKEPAKRLGCRDGGFRSLRSHAWLEDINLSKLINKEIPAPYTIHAKQSTGKEVPKWSSFAEMKAEVDSASIANLMGEGEPEVDITDKDQEYFKDWDHVAPATFKLELGAQESRMPQDAPRP